MSSDSGGDVPGHYVTRLAIDAGDLEAVERLRYEVTVAEMGKKRVHADAHARRLPDPLDAAADIIVVADAAGELVGTIRSCGFGSGQDWTAQDGWYTLREFAHLPRALLGMCTHLAVQRAHRRFVVRDLLFQALYAVQLERGIRLCFTTSPPTLARMFERYGFREYASPAQDAENGPVLRLVLALDDLDHLERIGSPFHALARARDVAPAVRPWLDELIRHWSRDPAG
ncbi:MAG TPA: GNAT family N-acyltransferase [Pseudomonadota bacterium]|nr:GNAT family N-acetyltransferase [Xanthomonadales bacterium]MBP8177656.1 GNAT family N-acetyltransferase [Xanthomonadales bacterium]HQX25636.1 GNAT family N-acyltransferase [Pseudomonadota bacterium]HQY37509.1 GNAT family N-acyltransferase [Pseudomonadota bacterium]HRA38543.1 GNAT family N-acyltransferase [Pseudomonadota bacterium]